MKATKPQKRSIRDFFGPAIAKDKVNGNPQLHDGNHERNSPPIVSHTHNGSLETTTSDTPSATPAVSRVAPVSPTPLTSSAAGVEEVQPHTTSQTSINSRESKRRLSHAEEVVLNTDSESDMDLESLPDLDFWKSSPIVLPVNTTTPLSRSKRISVDDGDTLHKPPKKTKSEQFDLLVETTQRNMEEIERAIQADKAEVERNLTAPAAAAFTLNERMLGQAVQDNDDPDQARRLYLAVQRTNATQVESAYHFFTDTMDSVPSQIQFPRNSLPEHRWAASFQKPSSRDQAFLTGFANQVFRVQELPRELASWMIDQVCSDRNQALTVKYLEILQERPHQYGELLDRNRLDDIFEASGANMESLTADDHIIPTFDDQPASAPSLPSPLKSIVKLLEKAAPWLRTKARSRALYILCYVCMDDRVIANADILRSVKDTIEALLCNYTENQGLRQGVGSPSPTQEAQSLIASQLNSFLPQLLSQVENPVLQRNLVRSLPASSPLTAYFQRHLALAFLLYPKVLDTPFEDPGMPQKLREHLTSSVYYHVQTNTNYSYLAARLTLLDIAIGPGLLTVPYLPLISPPASPTDSSPVNAPLPSQSDISSFNEHVNSLVQHIKVLGNSIVEAGAVTDLTILEAKDCIEKICSRLEYAVRIGGKKHHNVFGTDNEEQQRKIPNIFQKLAQRKRVSTRSIFAHDGVVNDGDAANAQIQADLAD